MLALLHEADLAYIRSDAAMMQSCLEAAERICIEDGHDEDTRRNAARWLWRETGLPRQWGGALAQVTDPTLCDRAAWALAVWLARHSCCEMNDLIIVRAVKARWPRLTVLQVATIHGPTGSREEDGA